MQKPTSNKPMICLLIALFFMASCRPTRGYEHVTKDYIGYGTYKAPNKKGLDK